MRTRKPVYPTAKRRSNSFKKPWADLVAAVTIYGPEQTPLIIVLQQGHTRFLKLLESGFPNAEIVIIPPGQLLASDIILPGNPWRVESCVVHATGRGVHPAVGNAVDHNVSRRVDMNNEVDWYQIVDL